MFCLTSPTEKVGARLEQFWDSTLLRVPNRIEKLLQMDSAGVFNSVPPREVVLDRKTQHLDICKDSQDTVKNCQRISRLSKAAGIAAVVSKVLGKTPKAIASPVGMSTTLALCFIANKLAKKLEREYYFKYTDDCRQKDLSKINDKIWMDKE